jgi:iron complex outermembrane recepter protein
MFRKVSACVAQAIALSFITSAALSAEPSAPVHAEELETVVVTASPIGDPDRLATISGSVDRAQLLRSGANTIADALTQVAGVTSSGFAAGAGRPVIRGMDANRVRTLEDGIGSFDVSDVGPDHGVPIDPFVAERVEIVRGAATLRYGSQAIGGVVNTISNRIPLHATEGSPTGDVAAGVGSNASSNDLAGQVNARSGMFAVHADAFSRHAGNYDTPDGEMANSWLRGKGAALGAAWISEENRVGLGLVRHESRYGIPGEDAYIDMKQDKVTLRSSFALSTGPFHSLTVDAGAANYEHSERDETGAALSTFLDDEWDARAETVLGPMGRLNETAIGVQMQSRDFSALGEGQDYLSPTRTRSQAVFAFTEAHLTDAARLQFGARVEDVDVDGTPITDVPTARSFAPFSASVGGVVDFTPELRLGVSLSSAARAPAQTELFARGLHEATATYELGSSALKLERANSAELSVRWRAGRVHADGSLWTTKFSNYIYARFTGRSCSEVGACVAGDVEEFAELSYTQNGARFTGAEAHAEIELLQGASHDLHLNLLADTVRAKLDNGGGDVPRIPPYHLGAGLAWQAGNLDASLFVKYSAPQNKVAANETPTAGFTTVDAQLGWRPWAQHQGVEISLAGRNLTDSVQRNAVALNKDEIMLPGRDLRLMFRVQFN